MPDKPAKFKQARIIWTGFAVLLAAGVVWELYSGVAIHKTGGLSHRATNPGLYWFEMAFQVPFTMFVAWFAYRGWRSR